MLKAIKIRIYPDSVQKEFISKQYPSTKTCYNCGYTYKGLKLCQRELVCQNCGDTIDRDYNAALNILDEGLKQLN